MKINQCFTIFKKFSKQLLLVSIICCFSTICKSQFLIPFIKKGELIMIKIKLENKEAVFIFDTGATTTVIDSAAATKFQLKSTGSQNNTSAGGISTFKYITHQRINLTNTNSFICDRIIFANLESLKERIGLDFDGIIGFDILSRFITKIDYETSTLSCYTEITKNDLTNYSKIPFTFSNGIAIPQFEITMILNNGEQFKGQILFDSGAALTLLVNTPFKEKNQLTAKIGTTITTTAQDLFKQNQFQEAAIKAMTIGSYTFEDLPVSLSNATVGVSSYNKYIGILGNKIIQRFNIIADYTKKILYLKPNNLYELPFDFPLSGIKLKKVKGELIITDVIEKSEAEVKGLSKNQKIITIDDYSGNDMDIIRKILQQEGKIIKLLIVESNGEKKEISLLLKRLI